MDGGKPTVTAAYQQTVIIDVPDVTIQTPGQEGILEVGDGVKPPGSMARSIGQSRAVTLTSSAKVN